MKTNNNIDEQQLLELLRRYFDGQTTLDQERQMRRMLAESDSSHELVQEGKAVVGATMFAGIAPADTLAAAAQPRRSYRLWAASLAAAVAVGVVIATLFFTRPVTPEGPAADARPSVAATDGECYAYVGNMRIDDSEAVLDIISQQLADMQQASEQVDIQLYMPYQIPNKPNHTIDTI